MGKMNGHTVTNSVSGAYELLKNNKMKTLSFGGTKVGEPGWGNKFWECYSYGKCIRAARQQIVYFLQCRR